MFGMGTGGPSALEKPTVELHRYSGYNPEGVSVDLFSRAVASQVLSALQSLTAVFGMGTGGPSALKTLTSVISFGKIRNNQPYINEHGEMLTHNRNESRRKLN